MLQSMRYQTKINYRWSDSIAYSVGLMASDGCLQSDGRHLDLTSVDTEQLKNFSKAIGKNLRISLKHNSPTNRAYRVQFSDVAYYDFLIRIGLTPRKSKTINELAIPDKFYTHFLRGLFDGDGTTYSYMDLRWKNSFLYYVCFVSASKDFLKYIASMNSKIIETNGSSIRKSGRAYILSYAKNDSYLLYKFMYKNTASLFLSRKRQKLEASILRDRGDII